MTEIFEDRNFGWCRLSARKITSTAPAATIPTATWATTALVDVATNLAYDGSDLVAEYNSAGTSTAILI
ncbi:MAG: hypothetical protein LUQ11_01330 [Methylococcaceae bacterium]|nr:hypothetical protein [Methylococcaceae bacterium]